MISWLLLSLFIRFPHLLGFSILTPEYAASKVVDAIEKKQTILMMPRGAYFSTALQQYVQKFDSHSNNRICLELTEKSLLLLCQSSQNAKVNRFCFLFLEKKIDCCCQNSFLFFCQLLSVLPEKTVASFRPMLPVTLVKVKKSSPKSLSTNCRYTVGQLSPDSIPTVNRQLNNSKLRLKKLRSVMTSLSLDPHRSIRISRLMYHKLS